MWVSCLIKAKISIEIYFKTRNFEKSMLILKLFSNFTSDIKLKKKQWGNQNIGTSYPSQSLKTCPAKKRDLPIEPIERAKRKTVYIQNLCKIVKILILG